MVHGRSIVLEILNSKDETVFSKTTTVTRNNDSSGATTGSENFAWSINIAPSTASETSSKITFAELADGVTKYVVNLLMLMALRLATPPIIPHTRS